MDEKKIEEILEEIWIEKEKGSLSAEALRLSKQEGIGEDDIIEIERRGYISRKKDKVLLTEKGEVLASQIIRGHRLAERLMIDVLAIAPGKLESSACSFEHIIHHELADAICTLLGHPKECPHGRKIPSGPCCIKARVDLKSVIRPLSNLVSGSRCKVAYISSRHHPRLDRLACLGILPGAEITLQQTKPSYIIQVAHTQVALDKDILRDIYVRKVD